MLTIWVRNALLVQATLLLAVACVMLVPRLAGYVFGIWPQAGHLRWISVELFILSLSVIAGNLQQVSTTRTGTRRTRLLRKDRALVGFILAAAFGVAAWLLCRTTGFDPFAAPPINPVMSLAVAVLVVVGGYCLLPVGLAIFDWYFKPNYQQINYGQSHVQWFVVVPLLVCSYFFGAILWELSYGPLISDVPYGTLFVTAWQAWPFPLAVVFVSLCGLAFCSI